MSAQNFNRVIVQKTAIHDLLVSAAEAFNRESVGLLFGRESSGRATIERAFVFQIVADRTSTDVRIDPAAQRRMRETVDDLRGPGAFLGYFHSHPGTDAISSFAHLSEADLNTMRPGEIEILVSVQPAVIPYRKEISRKGRIIECVAGGRRFTVSAYEAISTDRPPFKRDSQISILTDEGFIA